MSACGCRRSELFGTDACSSRNGDSCFIAAPVNEEDVNKGNVSENDCDEE